VLEQDPLSLERIRSVLVRLEDTIIFDLIERAQFAQNQRIYTPGEFPELKELGFDGSWLEWFLEETETFHAKARRYTSTDEYPFTSHLPAPVLKSLVFPTILYPNDINANPTILAFYTRDIVPRIAKPVASRTNRDDDGNYGSAATIDVEVLQAISKRVHYGKFVSESKFAADPAAFVPHILKPNRQALEALITKPEVERSVLLRLRKKASVYAQDLNPVDANANGTPKIDVDGVVELYENYIIPLTKQVEIDYLLCRLDGLSEEEIDKLAGRHS